MSRLIDPNEDPRKKNVNKLGLNDKEQNVMNRLMDCLHAYLDLEYQHPSDMSEFIFAVHFIQGLLAARVVRRDYPEGWSNYSKDGKTYKEIINEEKTSSNNNNR